MYGQGSFVYIFKTNIFDMDFFLLMPKVELDNPVI